MAFIKQRKYKEALLDCEQALYINPNFAKAHLRAMQCYLVVGELQKALESTKLAVQFGDPTAAAKIPFYQELIKFETFALNAKEKKEWREAIFYLGKILEFATDSMKHTALKIECMIYETPNDMTNAIRFTTQIQEQFIEHADFLFWRGRVLIYNGQAEMGKKHLK